MNGPYSSAPSVSLTPSMLILATRTPATVEPVVGSTAVTRMMHPGHRSRFGGSVTISGCATQPLLGGRLRREHLRKPARERVAERDDASVLRGRLIVEAVR